MIIRKLVVVQPIDVIEVNASIEYKLNGMETNWTLETNILLFS